MLGQSGTPPVTCRTKDIEGFIQTERRSERQGTSRQIRAAGLSTYFYRKVAGLYEITYNLMRNFSFEDAKLKANEILCY